MSQRLLLTKPPVAITTQAFRRRQGVLGGAHPSSLAGPLLGPKADGPGAGGQPGTGAGAQQSCSSVSSYPGRFTNEFIKASQICTQGLHVPKWIELMLLSSKLPKEFTSNHLHLCCRGHVSQVWSS